MKRRRTLGTTLEAVERAESQLGRTLPTSFRDWLLEHNGLGVEFVEVFPVLDDRDPRKTWDSIVRNYQQNWEAWLENFDQPRSDFDHLLPFAQYGTGDFYCFDYSSSSDDGEVPVVRWSHETGGTEFRAGSFAQFVSAIERGEISD